MSITKSDMLAKLLADAKASHWQCQYLEQASSTMQVAREGVNSRNSPLLIVAETQTNGRGRQGNKWSSPVGGLYATYAFKLDGHTTSLSGFSLAVGVILAELLEKYGVLIKLKWPNDLYLNNGKKLGGILIETLPIENTFYILIGIGINFITPHEQSNAASFENLENKSLTTIELAALIAPGLEAGLNLFLLNGLSAFIGEWNKRDYLQSKKVEITDGQTSLLGIVVGIANSGALILDVAGNKQEILSGHVQQILA
jgi:BirA family transcriptional regulator, biotin operon repressor / biotin---[acetyl-CoA-carboxylase] ligase